MKPSSNNRSERGTDLVINGYPLAWRHMGTGVYTRRIIESLRGHAPHISFRVIVPESFAQHTADLPPDCMHFLPGQPPIDRSMAHEVYWNHRIGAAAAHWYPDAVLHAPRDFWSLARPRRTVVTLHDCTYRFFPRLQGGWVRQWWYRATECYARSATLVLTQSIASRNDLITHAQISARKIRVLYPWIDAEEFRESGHARKEEVRQKYHLPQRFFLYFGGFNLNKNVEFLIRAYAQAAATQTLPPLVLAGHINENLRLAVCDVRGAIRTTGLSPEQAPTPGFIAEEDVPGLLAAADLLIYPSSYEGFGYPPAEAMAVGTPVLVSDASSLPEVVRNAECRFPLGEPSGLVAKLVAAARSAEMYRCPFPDEFQEAYGVSRYLQLLGLNESSAPTGDILPRTELCR